MDNSNYNNGYGSEFLDLRYAEVNPRCMPAKIKIGEENYWNHIDTVEKKNRALGIEPEIKVIYRRGHVEDMPETIGMADQQRQNRECGLIRPRSSLHRAALPASMQRSLNSELEHYRRQASVITEANNKVRLNALYNKYAACRPASMPKGNNENCNFR